MPESSGHVLETLWEDEEFVLFRGVWNGEPFPLLAAAPSAAQPSPESLARLQHSYALRDELDPAWAARPSTLEPRGGRRRRRLLQSPSRPRIAIFALRISPGKAGDT
jgi:hypothetical protein